MKPSFCIVLFLICASCSYNSDQSEEDAVKKVVLDFQEDFNEGSFEKAEKYAAEDWIHINPGGGMDVGKENILKGVRGVHQSFLKGVTMTTDSMNVRFVTLDVALATAYHTMDNYTTPDGKLHENERQIKSYVVVKKNGTWLLMMDHNTIIQN